MTTSRSITELVAHLRGVARPVDNEAVDRLRHRADAQSRHPSVDQFCDLVDALRTVTGSSTSNRLDAEARTGLSTDQLVDAIVALGGFLVRSRGDHGVVFVDSIDIPPMFNAPSTAWGTGKQRTKEVPPLPTRPTLWGLEMLAANEALRPTGFGIDEVGRDIDRSVRAIVGWAPSRSDITRFVARTFAPKASPLSFELISAVWMFDQLGRLDEIDDVSPTGIDFQRNVVKAFDLLEFARRDALTAIADMIDGDVDVTKVTCASLLFEADMARLAHFVEADRTDLVDRERRWVTNLAASGRFDVARIGELNAGQVLRVCAAAGIDVTAVTRSEETAIREELHRIGLGDDADQLVRVGVAAIRQGASDEFWAACQRRLEGDPAWAESLSGVGSTLGANPSDGE